MSYMAEWEYNDTPFRVGILLIDGFALLSYASVVEPLRAANLLGKQQFYDVSNIPALGSHAVSSSGAILPADCRPGEKSDFDLVLVVAGGDPTKFRSERINDWLRQMSRKGVLLGGVSGGPVILAQAGLLRDRRFTVHWEHAPTLSEISPSLMIERNLYVIDRDRVTCAGGTAAIDLMHVLIAEHHGPEIARLVSDWFLHTDIRPSAGPQRGGIVERYGSTNRFVTDAIETMGNHVADPISLSRLAQYVGASIRQLNRLFRENLGISTIAFYRDLRLEKANNLLIGSPLGITEIAYATGFSSSAHFSKTYKAKFGQPPSKSRKRILPNVESRKF